MSELFIEQLQLSHFRSHKLARIAADGRPIAIYGANGAGKTNILEAVSLFSPGRGMRRAAAKDMAKRPESLGWKLAGVVCSDGVRHEVETASEDGGARSVKLDGKPCPQVALGRLTRVVWLIPSMDRLWIEGAEGRRRFLDRMTLSFFPEHSDHALDYEKAMRERNRLLKAEVRDSHWYGALEAQMARSGAAIHAGRRAAMERLREAQDGAETAFPTADLELLQSEGELPDGETDLAEALAESRFRDMAAGRALIGPHRSDLYGVFAAKGVPAKDCSTGEQKALLISLILANVRALKAELGLAPIVLLDEVAAHLDADRRAALYDEICALGSQAWMTGTGPELFAELGARAQHLVVTEEAGVSAVAVAARDKD